MASSSYDSSFDNDMSLQELSDDNISSAHHMASSQPSKNSFMPKKPAKITGKQAAGKAAGLDDSGSFSYSADNSPLPVRSANDTYGNRTESLSPPTLSSSPRNAISKAAKPTASSDSNKVDDDIGFVPSFLERDGKSRQRRQLGRSAEERASHSKASGSLDQLDIALGLGGGSGPVRKSTDPFAKFESSRPAPKSSTADDSDSDSDDVKQTTTSQASYEEEEPRGIMSRGSNPSRAGLSVKIEAPSALSESGDSEIAKNPAWLPGSASPSNIGGAASPLPSGSKEASIIKLLQQKLEAAQLEREAVERKMKLEIEGLKLKLTVSQSAGSAAGGVLSEGQLREYEEVSMRYLKEQSDFKRHIAQLELEISRLKDEATIVALKNHEEKKYINDKYVSDLKSKERKYDEEVLLIEKRHSEAVLALKNMHKEELTSIRERSKDGIVLEQLAGQIRNTSGSIKLIEEQLNARYRGLDVAREGQLEARERFLNDLEEKAKEKLDSAEQESYRLKGLLMHMETVITNLRAHGGEEKERLRAEHQRLVTLQTVLEIDRKNSQDRVSEELALLKQKMRDTEAETRRLHEDKRTHEEYVASSKKQLDVDRSEFVSYVQATRRATETTSTKLKEEEDRLQRIREELYREKSLLEQKRIAAMNDLQDADKLRAAMNKHKDDVIREKQILQRTAHDLHSASEELARREAAIEEHEKVLNARELALREGLAQMKSAAMELQVRETSVTAGFKKLEEQQAALMKVDNELMQRRLVLATTQREVMQSQTQQHAPTNELKQLYDASVHLNTDSDWTAAFKQRLAGKQKGGALNSSSGDETRALNELRSAQKLLDEVRSSNAVYQSTLSKRFLSGSSAPSPSKANTSATQNFSFNL